MEDDMIMSRTGGGWLRGGEDSGVSSARSTGTVSWGDQEQEEEETIVL